MTLQEPQGQPEHGRAVSLKLLIVGYGKMGRMVAELAADQDIEIVGHVDESAGEWREADVAVDFSTAAAVVANFPKYVQSKMNVVIGTSRRRQT